jgi:phosphopantothenoylcysteine decarboxylase/phosphopantothenate--cysteine ligase
MAEHICMHDVVVVAPATLNTFNKIMLGIADNPVTTLIASALGKKVPVYVAPTMHGSLYENPIFQRNLSEAAKYGIKVIEPRFSEGKAKMPRIEKIVNVVLNDLRGGKNEGQT